MGRSIAAVVAAAAEERTPHGIAAGIARLINAGELAPGDRLPTVRELATELGVSPATVSGAWQSLAGVGLIVSRGRSGSFVRAGDRQWLPPRFRPLARQVGATRLDLSTGTPDPLLLPPLGPALARLSSGAATASYLDRPVIPELEALLRATWPAPVESVTVLDGALDGISRTLDLLLRYGDRVVVEDPGFPPVLDLLDAVGAERVPVPLDEHGLRPDLLAAALLRSPVAIVLQPRAHNPTGVSMTAERAAELARVIRQSRHAEATIIIEDDHSGAIAHAPDVTLAAWLPERVVHLRSFSKSHGPDLRIAALGGPARLVDAIVARRILGPGWTSRMTQTMLHHLLTDDDAVEHVQGAREEYARRQTALAAAVRAAGGRADAGDGINAWLPVADERAAIVRLAASGIRVAAGTPFQATGAPDRGAFVRVSLGALREGFEEIGALLAAAAVP